MYFPTINLVQNIMATPIPHILYHPKNSNIIAIGVLIIKIKCTKEKPHQHLLSNDRPQP